MQRIFAAIFLTTLLFVIASGCSMLADPGYSENYAIKAKCDIPEMIDGSIRTAGKMQRPEYVRGQPPDDSRYNDAIITIKEPKDIRKIIVRRRPDEVIALDINVFAMIDDEWKIIKQVRGADKQDINILVRTVTDKIKIRAQRASRTAKGKSGIAQAARGQRGGGRRQDMSRLLREPVLIAEIEIYGLKPKVEPEES